MSSTTDNARKIIVTQALPYANASLHLGHILEAVQTDIWSRFQNKSGNECLFFCADDTHGTPVMLKAEEENIEAIQEFFGYSFIKAKETLSILTETQIDLIKIHLNTSKGGKV